jgi:RND family efflux transporter MFP subunit
MTERFVARRSVGNARLKSTLFALIIAALPAACGGGGSDAAAATGGGAVPGQDRVIPVAVSVAELGSISRSVSATGTIEAIRTIGINSQTSGALKSVNVLEGDVVRQGTVLAEVDSREIEAQLRAAEATLEVARRAAERSEQLRSQKIITAAEYERDQAALASASATHDQLQTRASYTTIRSPINGVVTQKRVETGDVVSPQTRLFTIADVSTLVMRVPVSELEVTSIAEGDAVDVQIDALPDRNVRGRVRRIFPAADTASRLVPVEVALSGETARGLRIGFLGRVRFELSSRNGVLLVPATGVMESASESSVFVVANGKANRRVVQRGVINEGRVEILSGLAVGDSIVTMGQNMLKDGASIRVVNADGTDTAQPTISEGSLGAGATR